MDNRSLLFNAAPSPPTAPASPSVGFMTNGNPATATPAATPGAWWHHMIGEELRAVIVGAGLTPSAVDLTQLKTAMDTLYASGGRIRMGGTTTFYVATTGNDTLNTGLTVGSPFATLQKAWDTINKYYDLAGNDVIIQLADGTYMPPGPGIYAAGLMTGQTPLNTVTIQGNSTHPSNVKFYTASGHTIICDGANIILKYLYFETPFHTTLIAENNGSISIGPGITISAAGNYHMAAYNYGMIYITESYTINGGALIHWYASGGLISAPASAKTVTLSGSPVFSAGFAVSSSGGLIIVNPLVFSGSAGATTPRYGCSANGVITTNGAGASYIPGTSAGSTQTGGQYV